MVLVPRDAPPYIMFVNPTAGVGLRTKSVGAARKRIDQIISCGDRVRIQECQLYVIEPCGPLLRNALRGPGARSQLFDRIEDHASIAVDARQRFGAPHDAGPAHSQREPYVKWVWEHDGEQAPAAFDAWYPFALAHEDELVDGQVPHAGMRVVWRFRLRLRDGSIVDDPYPECEVTAYLGGRASVYLHVVLPFEVANRELLAEWDAVCAGFGVKLPLESFRLSKPNPRGGDRIFRKLELVM